MTNQQATDLAVALTDIPECPNSDLSIARLAKDLQDLCGNKADAEWLVQQARSTWKKWMGLAGLRDLMIGKRNPRPEQKVYSLGPKPTEELCPICNGWGHFYADGRNQFCTCSEGDWMRNLWPNMEEAMSRKGIRSPLGPSRSRVVGITSLRKPVTQADIDDAFSKRQNQTEYLISCARATLANPDASPDQIEIARETLRAYGAPESA